jgi:hypothetical protein
VGRPEKQPELPSGGYLLPGGAAISALLVGIALAAVCALLAASHQWRYDVAHDLHQVGDVAQAHHAEVYYACGRGCDRRMRAVVNFPAGSRAIEFDEPSFSLRGLPESRWVPAPEPYGEAFTVYYDPEHPHDIRRIMPQVDVEGAFHQETRISWIVLGALVVWSLAWIRPAVRRAGRPVRVLSVSSSASGDQLRRGEWRRDATIAVGLTVMGLGVLVCSGSAWNAMAAMHLASSGSVAEGFDPMVRVVPDADDRNVSDKVFAEIVVGQRGGADDIVPVELLAPAQRVDPELAPGWHASVAPYADGFPVRYDPDDPDLAIAVSDIDGAVRPGALIFPLVLLALAVSLVVWALARPSDLRRRRRRKQQALLPGMVPGSGPGVRGV